MPRRPCWGKAGRRRGKSESERVRDEMKVDEKIMQAIASILSKEDRVELIPVKDGVKVIRIRREEVRT